MRILELTTFSAGGCGVWARAREESIRLAARGHNVVVFSSNATKGSKDIARSSEIIEGVQITRFPFVKLGGESFMSFKFKKAALDFAPDVIIAHNYRHLHTTRALKIAKILRKKGKPCKVFLVTHAPFVEGNITRTFFQTLVVKAYDAFIGRKTINNFEKVLAISNWEIPYLENLGLNRDKITYIPNGIPEVFYSQNPIKSEDKILFLSRISPKKRLETLINAISLLKNKKIKLEIVGPKEEPYSNGLVELVSKLSLSERIRFLSPIYDLSEKIKKIDSCKLFVLPSRVEGMPQALIEALARGKIVIGSNSLAIRDLIKDKKNGYLFEFDNPSSLAEVIDLALNSDNSEISKEARNSVADLSWEKVILKIEKEIS